MDKPEVVDAIRAALQDRLATTQEALAHAQAAATADEARAENRYDTRALEMSYLAAGQSERVAELRRAVTLYHFHASIPCAEAVPGALIELEGARSGWYFLAPCGPSLTVEVAGETVHVVTTATPVGLALLGRVEGDEVQFGPNLGTVASVR